MPWWGWGWLLGLLVWVGFHFYQETQYAFIRAQRDHASDVDVLFSSKAFQQKGFRNLQGRLYTDETTEVPSYKGYPPLPNWGYYFLSKLGVTGIRAHRWAMALLSIAGMCLLGRVIYALAGWPYALGVLTYVALFPFYIWGGANFHHVPYGFFLLPAFLGALIWWERKPRARIRTLVLIGTSVLLSLSTYEYVVYSLIVGAGYLYIKRHSWRAAWAAAWRIGLGVAIALGIWYGINMLEKGPEAFLQDLLHRLTRRASMGSDTIINRAGGIARYLYRFEKDLGPGTLLTLLLFLGWSRYHARRGKLSFLDRFILILWLASVSWTVLMFNHALHHSYFVVPRSYYLAMAMTVVHLVLRLWDRWKTSRGPSRAGIGLLMALLVYLQLDRGMELFALHRSPIVPVSAREFIRAHPFNKPAILFYIAPYKEEARVWQYYLRESQDTIVRLRALSDATTFSDSLEAYCPHVALLVVKDRNSLFHRLYEPDRGWGISYFLRRRAVRAPQPIDAAFRALAASLHPCPHYEDERYILIYPCNCSDHAD